MSLIDHILRPPSYGWTTPEGSFYKPTKQEIIREFFSRLNIFKSRKNWLALTSWLTLLALLPFVVIFLSVYITLPLAILAFVYGMVGMGTHGTIWFHRYSTHRSYEFRNKFWLLFTQNLVPKMIPEEIYVISHHVHHAKSDTAGDPYNANGGWLYCFLADVNHQTIAHDLTEADYERVSGFLKHTGIYRNTYKQYLRWGSVSNPYFTVGMILLNVSAWTLIFFLAGGPAFMTAMMTGAFFWALGVRTFNFDGHGRGKDKRTDGKDFNRNDMSINQYWPGIVAGEWHNNHHLYPRSARSGFLKYQVDFAWYYIYSMHKLGAVSKYHDSKESFMNNYYKPYNDRSS